MFSTVLNLGIELILLSFTGGEFHAMGPAEEIEYCPYNFVGAQGMRSSFLS